MSRLLLFNPDTGQKLEEEPLCGTPIIGVGKVLPFIRRPRIRYELVEDDDENNEIQVSPKSENNGEILVLLDVARVVNNGTGSEVTSDREVFGTFEEVRMALQDLGFTILEWVFRKMFENIQVSLGLPKEEEKQT